MITNRKNVTIAMLLAIFLAAIEVTIVSTAMPTIVEDLGGIKLIGWVFSAYLLTSAVTTLIYGKLADLFGRRLIFTIGTSIFLVGSMLSGLSQTMVQLIIFRTIQGMGAGAILPIANTVVGDIYSVEERGKMQGIFSGVWGIAGIIGPLVGGFFVEYLTWHWIFFINVPFGILSIVMVWLFLHESFEKRKKHIDYKGALVFTISMSALLFALLNLQKYGWSSLFIIGLIGLFSMSFLLFIYLQQKTPEPILPLSLFKMRAISVSNSANFLLGTILIGLIVYLPMWVQGVLGGTPTNAGFALTALSLGWPLGASIGGRLMVTRGARTIALIGITFIFLGTLWLAFLQPTDPYWFLFPIMALMGLGFGFSITTFVVTIQSSVEWNMRGVAMATNSFLGTLGQTIGTAVHGSIFAFAVLQFGAGEEGIVHGIHNIFAVFCGIAVVVFLLTTFLPNHIPSAKEGTSTKKYDLKEINEG
jgi:EmrB/QacA subfamily drug resistance transporter